MIYLPLFTILRLEMVPVALFLVVGWMEKAFWSCSLLLIGHHCTVTYEYEGAKAILVFQTLSSRWLLEFLSIYAFSVCWDDISKEKGLDISLRYVLWVGEGVVSLCWWCGNGCHPVLLPNRLSVFLFCIAVAFAAFYRVSSRATRRNYRVGVGSCRFLHFFVFRSRASRMKVNRFTRWQRGYNEFSGGF